MPSRRNMLKGMIAASGTAAFASSFTEVHANWGSNEPSRDFDGRALVNKPQAYRVLDEAGLDGLVAFNPVNVFYLGNFLGYNVKIQTRAPSFAVFPRDEKKPTILVVGFGDLWRLANGLRETPEIIPYSAPTNWQDFVGAESVSTGVNASAGFGTFWPVTESGLSERERAWLEIEQRYEGRFMPTPEHALVKALHEAGLSESTVAVDDLRVRSILASASHNSTECVDGDNVFRKIRVIKSDVEIGHMRRIAIANQTATMNMAKALGPGATNADIDRLFGIEASKLGARSTWLAAGSIGGLPDGHIVANQPLLVDAVSQINYYHGDFGRTVVYGEPSKKLLDRARLLEKGWQAALAMMKPGVRYSEIEKVAHDAMKRNGVATPVVAVVPHSVGLQHTDEPYRDGLAFQVKDDLVLQENMTLTVDFPSLEPGWGNCHLEDLVRITKDGVEALATIDSPLVVV
ncbi:MAG: M24 family metallopeptidase [Pseudomonadota bacterium]